MNQALMFTDRARDFERIKKLPNQQSPWISSLNFVKVTVGGKLATSR